MADNTIDNLSIQVTASAEEASRVFDRLASNAGKLKDATSGAAQGMQQAADAAEDMGTSTQEAGEQAGQAQKPVRDFGNEAKNAGKNAKEGSSGLKTFWESLKRIAFYRAVRSIIRGITDAFKTGITNMYQWSKVMDGTFAKSMDRLATSSFYLKNSLGAMIAPIINALTPIIEKVVDGLVWIINHVNMLFAMLSGSQTYTVAKKVATTWGDAGKSAASSAKKASDDIKRTILGFDEINKLEKQNSSSGGSGSGTNKNGTDYASMFETKQLPSWMATIASVIDKFKLGWAGVLAGLLAGWAAVKKAIKAVSDLSLGWLKKMAGKTISIAVGIKTSVEELWEKFKKSWLRQTPVLQVGITLLTTAATLWSNFSKSWLRLAPVLKVGIATTITAAALWSLFQGAWSMPSIPTLLVAIAVSTSAAMLWNQVQNLWNTAKDVLTVDIKPNIQTEKAKAQWSGADAGELPGDQDVLTWKKLFDKLGLTSAANSFKGVGSWQGVSMPGVLPGDTNPATVSQLFAKLGNFNTKGLGKTVAAAAIGIVGAILAGGLPGLAASANNAVVLTPQNKLKQQLRPLNMPGAGRDSSKVVPKNTLPYDAQWLMNATAKNKINAFTSTVVTSVAKIKNAMFDGTKGAADAVHDFVDKYGQLRDNALGITWDRVGENATKTLKNGMDQSWYQATGSVNRGMSDMYNTALSKSFKPVGSKTVTDIDSGVRGGLPDAKSVMSYAMNGIYDTASQKSFTTIGTNAADEIGNGINSNSWSASNAMWDLMASIQNTADGFSLWDIGYNIAVDIYNGFVENINWVSNSISSAIRSLSNMINGTTRAATSTVKRITASKPTKSAKAKAFGGIFSNGIWTDIPQYASGTLNAGSLFWAGERGPELVGRAGGRTEVLNKSQLASAMYSAVQAAMAPASANFAAAASYLQSGSNAFDIETLAEMVRQGVESAMERQSDIQRQQLDTLRQINAKEFSTEISTASINKAQARMNRRAGMTITPVTQ